MRKFLEILRNTREVLVTVGAVLAAAIVAVETYETLRKKIDTARSSESGFLPTDQEGRDFTGRGKSL